MTNSNLDELDKFIQTRKQKIAEREGKPFEKVVRDIIIAASTDPTLDEEAKQEAASLIPWAKKRYREAILKEHS